MSKIRHAHFTDWSKVAAALSDYGVTDEESARTFLETADKDTNPFYYMVCYIRESKEIYTHGKFYGFSGIESVKPLIDELAAEIEDNEYVMAVALTELQAYKQEVLVSGETIKTVNGESILGEGDLIVSADVNLEDYVTKDTIEALNKQIADLQDQIENFGEGIGAVWNEVQ